jgi:hypothetical protein
MATGPLRARTNRPVPHDADAATAHRQPKTPTATLWMMGQVRPLRLVWPV